MKLSVDQITLNLSIHCETKAYTAISERVANVFKISKQTNHDTI
jgi:hypothetical protein